MKLPPGRARLTIKPAPMGSETLTNTTGISTGFPKQCAGNLGRMCQDYIWLKGNQFLGKLRHVGTGWREANLNAEIAAFRPAKFLHFIFEYRKTLLRLRIVVRKAHQDRDVPDPLRLLRACSERPSSGQATDKLDELAPLHATL